MNLILFCLAVAPVCDRLAPRFGFFGICEAAMVSFVEECGRGFHRPLLVTGKKLSTY